MSDRPRLFSPKAGSRGMDDLQYAAYCGDLEGVHYFLAEGSDVVAADDFGWTALHWNCRMACTPGSRNAIIEVLVSAGADINQRDKDGKTVLGNAIEATAPESMIRLLKSLGAK